MEKRKIDLLDDFKIEELKIDFTSTIDTLLNAGKNAELKKRSLFKIIKNRLEIGEDEEEYYKSMKNLDTHEKVARRVFRRLLLRNAQLYLLTVLTKGYDDFNSTKKDTDNFMQSENDGLDSSTPLIENIENKNDKTKKNDNSKNEIDQNQDGKTLNILLNQANKPKQQNSKEEVKKEQKKEVTSEFKAYKHAITDLFVEKAITYLEEKANKYNRLGIFAYVIGLTIILGGIGIAASQYLFGQNILQSVKAQGWEIITTRFIMAFTFYGFIVLAAVGLWRFGRAMLDQAERLLERRHALRQGRLFVHLHGGELSIEDMEKAFQWNVNNYNAFSEMNTDAKAPWGQVMSEAIKGSSEVAKTVKDISDNFKNKTSN
jgi:hypothetical protein